MIVLFDSFFPLHSFIYSLVIFIIFKYGETGQKKEKKSNYDRASNWRHRENGKRMGKEWEKKMQTNKIGK